MPWTRELRASTRQPRAPCRHGGRLRSPPIARVRSTPAAMIDAGGHGARSSRVTSANECGQTRVVPAPPSSARSSGPTGPGQDRLTLEKPAEVVRKSRGGGITPRRLLGHRLQADGLHVGGNLRDKRSGGPGLVVNNLVNDPVRLAVERRFTGEAFIECGA